MTYKDRTWCTDYTCKKFDSCATAFTHEEKEKAIAWWGGTDAPVSLYSDRLLCYEAPNEQGIMVKGTRPQEIPDQLRFDF